MSDPFEELANTNPAYMKHYFASEAHRKYMQHLQAKRENLEAHIFTCDVSDDNLRWKEFKYACKRYAVIEEINFLEEMRKRVFEIEEPELTMEYEGGAVYQVE